jgi:parallel beta-helix repeat protein
MPNFAESPFHALGCIDMSRFGIVGIYMAGPKPANAKVVGNHISGGPWGIYVTDTHQGSFTGNQVHDNCAGMFFEAFKAEPVAPTSASASIPPPASRKATGTAGTRRGTRRPTG